MQALVTRVAVEEDAGRMQVARHLKTNLRILFGHRFAV